MGVTQFDATVRKHQTKTGLFGTITSRFLFGSIGQKVRVTIEPLNNVLKRAAITKKMHALNDEFFSKEFHTALDIQQHCDTRRALEEQLRALGGEL